MPEPPQAARARAAASATAAADAARRRPLTPVGRATSGEARLGAAPAGVERRSRLVEVEDHRGMVGRGRRPLARLPVDLDADDPRGGRRARQQVVDPHPLVALEVAGAVVPPGEAAHARVGGTPRVGESPRQERPEGRPLRLRHVRAAVCRRRVPDVVVGRRDVEVSPDEQRHAPGPASRRASARAARTSAACRRTTPSRRRGRWVRRCLPCGCHRRPPTACGPRCRDRSRPRRAPSAPGPELRTGPSPKFVTTSSNPTRLAIATPFQRPSPWWSRS